MDYKLNPKIFTDNNNYFFTILTDRFYPLNSLWAKSLEDKFGKKFEPIYILPSVHNKLFEEENYIILNHKQEGLQRILKRKNVIYLIYPEDLNRQFSKSKFVQTIINKLLKKQEKIFVLSFSSVWLDIQNPNVFLLGPDPKVAEKFDNKIEHIKIFKKLGLPLNHTKIYPIFRILKSNKGQYPFFLSAAYSSGGFESKVIYTSEDLDIFYSNLRPVNRRGPFIVADLIEDIILSPNTSAIVYGKDKTELICISDQILRDNRYMGNIYPSKSSINYKKIMIDATIKVGNYMSQVGFRGLFGCDFIIANSGQCFITDLNPRRQGGYFCNVMMSQKIDIVKLELDLVLGDKLPHFGYQDFQVNYFWAHSKLTPYFNNMKIEGELSDGKPSDPFRKIGFTHKAIYYPKNSILLSGNPGFYVTSGFSYDLVKLRLIEDTEKIISKNFRLYEGFGKT